jgi:elongation factor G
MCGSALSNIGIKLALDAVIDYLPAPTDIPAIECFDKNGNDVMRHPNDSEPFTAMAFKIMTDPFVGRLAFFRVYSGCLMSGSYIMNATKNVKERVGRILQMHANHRKEITEVYCGEIAAAVGLKSTTTADTLCDENHPVVR